MPFLTPNKQCQSIEGPLKCMGNIGVRSIISTLFSRWQRRCGLSLSVLQRLVTAVAAVTESANKLTLNSRCRDADGAAVVQVLCVVLEVLMALTVPCVERVDWMAAGVLGLVGSAC